MAKIKRMSGLIALMMLCAALFSGGAIAAEDWRTPYLNVLKQGAGQLRAVGLCDLSGDGTPEMAVLTVGSSGAGTLKVYSLINGKAAEMSCSSGGFDIDKFSLQGVKSVGMTLHVGGSGVPYLALSLKAVQGKQTTTFRVCLTQSAEGVLKPVYVSNYTKSSGKEQCLVNGESVTSAQFVKAKQTFETSYKKKGKLPTQTLARADKAAAIQSKFNKLRSKHASFATIKSLKLSKQKATLESGQSLALSYQFSPSTAITDEVSWSSSDSKVATVSQAGKVQAVAAGTATITAKAASGKKASCTLTIKGVQPTSVTLSESVLTMTSNGSATLEASVLPQGASRSLSWSSSNKNVVSVTQDGKLSAQGVGKATITVKTANGKKASCSVVVNDRDAVIVDISQHEYSSKMDWALIAKNVDLLILRCGVTRTETDPIGVGKDDKFAYYAKKCQEYGIPYGVYFYGKCSDTQTAIEEAEMTWKIASPYNPLFYVYDAEEARLNKELIETYIKKLKSLGAKKTGYYIAHHLYSKYKLDTSLVDFIWLPHYGKNTGSVNSTPSYACDLHQYTSVARIPGFAGVVDVSRLMGTKSLAWFLKR